MATSFLTSLSEEEFKNFLKQALIEIIGGKSINPQVDLPEIVDIKQAADYLKLKVTTLYEKTSQKIIPHFKKGNKLYFNIKELQGWVQGGKVKTQDEIQGLAATYALQKGIKK